MSLGVHELKFKYSLGMPTIQCILDKLQCTVNSQNSYYFLKATDSPLAHPLPLGMCKENVKQSSICSPYQASCFLWWLDLPQISPSWSHKTHPTTIPHCWPQSPQTFFYCFLTCFLVNPAIVWGKEFKTAGNTDELFPTECTEPKHNTLPALNLPSRIHHSHYAGLLSHSSQQICFCCFFCLIWSHSCVSLFLKPLLSWIYLGNIKIYLHFI